MITCLQHRTADQVHDLNIPLLTLDIMEISISIIQKTISHTSIRAES